MVFFLGERINHNEFGEGVIESIDDNRIIVQFRNYGQKKLLVDFANQFITRYGEYIYYDSATKAWYNINGFDVNGYDKDGYNESGYNLEGYNRMGIHKLTQTYYGPNGYTEDGYDKNGFDVEGIHKETGTQYSPLGYDVNGNHKSEGYAAIIQRNVDKSCELRFDGFYHMTALQNISSIIKTKKLYSRNHALKVNSLAIDMKEQISETESVLNKTSHSIQEYARLYFRSKTPTFYKFEKMANVALLKFDKRPLCIKDALVSVGNAGKWGSQLVTVNSNTLSQIDFRTVLSSSDIPKSEYEKNMRHTELLIPTSLSTEYLEAIIFKTEVQKQEYLAHNKIINGIEYIVSKEHFF